MATFTFHTDAAHGWLEVSGPDLSALGFKPADFSRYSYADLRGTIPTYFLEEDCDASKFVARFTERNGALPTFKDAYQHNSFVRNLPRLA